MTQASSHAEHNGVVNLAIVPVIAPNCVKLYRHRAARIAQVKQDSPLRDYLSLLEQLVSTQLNIAEKAEFGPAPDVIAEQLMPFSLDKVGYEMHWQGVLLNLIDALLPQVSDPIAVVLKRLATEKSADLQSWSQALRANEFSRVPGEYSLFIWAALSVYWAHWAPLVVVKLPPEDSTQQALCPVCGSHPIASEIVEKPRKGLRYLHCSLCETRWHLVRAICTACHQDDGISLWAEQEKEAPVRIESCDHCHGYTKMMFTDIAPELDVAIDDLLSQHFDQQLALQGYQPTTVNPFLLTHKAN